MSEQTAPSGGADEAVSGAPEMAGVPEVSEESGAEVSAAGEPGEPGEPGENANDAGQGPENGDARAVDSADEEPADGDAEIGTKRGSDRTSDRDSDSGRAGRLEREGDIAADYLEEFLDIVDVDGDIDLDVEGDRAMVAIVGGDLNQLVGDDGEVLESLQELTRLAVYRETDERSRLMLDIGGFRARRREELVRLAEKVITEAREGAGPVRMEPMSPFERKVVHDAVSAAGLVSESEGEEPNRRVVVRLA